MAITHQDGQQDVAIKGCCSGTSRIKSLASSMVHRSAPMATSTTSSKPSSFMAGFSFSGVISRAELAHKRRRHGGDDAVALVDGLDDLEDLAFVRNGAKRAVYKAHAAGYALVVIDLGAAELVGADGVHAAGLGAGALHLKMAP